MTEEKLINRVNLDNGLELSFYDCSRRIATDTWQVSVLAKISIDTDKTEFTITDKEKLSEIRQTIGKIITFEKKIFRSFIIEEKKEETLQFLYESFLDSTKNYFSSKQFAERLALKIFADSLKKRKEKP